MKNVWGILFASLTTVTILFIIEQVLVVDYLIKTLSKITLFSLTILLVHYFGKKKITYLSPKGIDKKRRKISISIGLGAFFILIAAYLVLQSFIDFSVIENDLAQKNIIKESFLLIGLYITFGNSFLEEIYFRGFIFKNLQKTNKKFAYFYSSFLFSIYHTAIFLTWFSPTLFLLALFGLFVIGLVFCWLNEHSTNIYNSWFVHVLADIAIILIALHAVF
ncbi:CPBP family intramembrane glutamic endopeptidase [Bacillaceae bacterium S4-13-58]